MISQVYFDFDFFKLLVILLETVLINIANNVLTYHKCGLLSIESIISLREDSISCSVTRFGFNLP